MEEFNEKTVKGPSFHQEAKIKTMRYELRRSYIEEIMKTVKQFGKKLKIQLDTNLIYRECNKSN